MEYVPADLFRFTLAQVLNTGGFGIFKVSRFDVADNPRELPAWTPKEYVTPGRKPERVALPLTAPTRNAVTESGVEVTVYDSITDPPLFAGALNETCAEVFPERVIAVAVGESGTESGITFTAAELALVPFRLLAWTETE
jgi:hypothetical protein